MAIFAWLWKDGVHDFDLGKQLVTEALKASNPHAYLAREGPARTCRSDQTAIARAERENGAAKRSEREWLDGGS